MTAIPEAIRTSLNATLDYLWGDEQANYKPIRARIIFSYTCKPS